MTLLPLMSDLDAALSTVDAEMSAAEAHGLLCGMLCARGACDIALWQQHVLGDAADGALRNKDISGLLTDLYRATVEQLNDALTEFHLLLPDEDDPLPGRVSALADWCLGFVLGLAEGGISRDTKLPDDSDEIMRDIIQISRADAEGAEALDDEDEVDFMEIVEYVRTGVLLMNEELQPLKPNTTLQ